MKNVVLTHSVGRLNGLAEQLIINGLNVFHQPLVEIKPVQNVKIAPLLECDWWLLTSISAVNALTNLGVSFQNRNIGAVGIATSDALQRAGARVALTGHGTARDLGNIFLEHVQHGIIGLPVGNQSLNVLRDMLEVPQVEHSEFNQKRFEIRSVVVYQNQIQSWPAHMPKSAVIVLASPSAVTALPISVARSTQLVAVGPTTAQSVHSLGLTCLMAREPTVTAVLETVLEFVQNSMLEQIITRKESRKRNFNA